MDSFSIFFPHELSVNEISPAILAVGKVHVENARYMVVTNGDGAVWISIHQTSELKDNGYDNEDEWPLPKDKVGSAISILVRRNDESTGLANTIAHQLVKTLDGRISWGGMTHWERLYKRSYPER